MKTHWKKHFSRIELSFFPNPATGPDCEASSSWSHSCIFYYTNSLSKKSHQKIEIISERSPIDQRAENLYLVLGKVTISFIGNFFTTNSCHHNLKGTCAMSYSTILHHLYGCTKTVNQIITLCAGRSRSLFSLITFHICCALKENPEAGTTPRRSPARPPGAIEWLNRCLKLATFIPLQEVNRSKYPHESLIKHK